MRTTTDNDIPASVPLDAVMAGPAEIQQVIDWAGSSFAGISAKIEGLLTAGAPPFFFIYGGVRSEKLLPSWKRDVTTTQNNVAVEHLVRWADKQAGLVVTATVKVFKQYPAVDWVLHFENTGTTDTPIIEGIQALDVMLDTNDVNQPLIVHRLEGDACGDKSFTPFKNELAPNNAIRMLPTGGRSSNITAFPFFNLQSGNRGAIVAIGWSGQWVSVLERTKDGPTRLTAGMEITHFFLRPGEKVRTPRIVIMPWTGDRITAHNRWRRLLLFHYVPQSKGRPVSLPIALQCYDRYSFTRTDWATEAGQIAAAKSAADLGADHLWLDAAWFPGGFPHGVGSWFTKPEEFPNGLKPVSAACYQLGLKFILWFEPERVGPGTQIATEHPEFVLAGKDWGLYKLNNPAARRYLTDLLSRRITEYGVDLYRNDFNMDPLPFWRANDTLDRRGITEIQYVEGLYTMWDELLAKHPGLLIDNCASGGRRLDIEICKRSVPLWRSDTNCFQGHSERNQVQTANLGQYLPLHAAGPWTPEPYDFRSGATLGVALQFDYLAPGFPMAVAKAAIAEVKGNQKYWYGDFYPLAGAALAADHFVAYQFHRADLNAGLVLAFRHEECETTGISVALRGLNPDTSYKIEFSDEARHLTSTTMTGKELQTGLQLRIPGKGASLLVNYLPVRK